MDTTMHPTTPAPPRRLTRSRNDRMLAGVAGGIGNTYGFDPNIVRIVVVIGTIATAGALAIAYVVAWLIVPETDAAEPMLSSALRHSHRLPHDGRLWIGIALLLFGGASLADRFRFGLVGRAAWPLFLIGAGAAVLLLRDRDLAPEVPVPGPSATAPPPPPMSPDPSAGPDGSGSTGGGGPAEAPEPAGASAPWPPPGGPAPPGVPPVPSSAYPPSLPWPAPPRPKLPRVRTRERSMLGRFTWSALLLVAGGAWLIDLTNLAAVDVRLVSAIELAVVGVALLVGTWFGRSRGLIAIGLVLTFFAGTFAALDVPLRGDIGDRIVQPATMNGLGSSYHLGVGHLELDLRDTPLDGKAHRVVLTDAIGFIAVFVPANARVEVKARADIGSISILDRPERGGTHTNSVVVDDPPGASGPRILIDAHVGFGAVRVERAVSSFTFESGVPQ